MMDGTGDCFDKAFDAAFELKNRFPGTVYLCHGCPIGRGPIAGIEFWHAWVEIRTDDGVLVLDRSNGLNHVGPAEAYYAIGNIDPMKVIAYTVDEAVAKILEYRHYGPWNDNYPPLPWPDSDDDDDDERLQERLAADNGNRTTLADAAAAFGIDLDDDWPEDE